MWYPIIYLILHICHCHFDLSLSAWPVTLACRLSLSIFHVPLDICHFGHFGLLRHCQFVICHLILHIYNFGLSLSTWSVTLAGMSLLVCQVIILDICHFGLLCHCQFLICYLIDNSTHLSLWLVTFTLTCHFGMSLSICHVIL